MSTELKDVSVQRVVDLIGTYIVNDNISPNKSASKSFGEVEIKNVRYQVQITLVPDEINFNPENGIITKKVKLSWKQKIINLFTFATGAGIQK